MIATQELTQYDMLSDDSITYHTPVLAPEITLQETQAAMKQLVGKGIPNVKAAFFNAACSVQCSVDINMQRAGVLRAYWHKPLPVNRDVLRAELHNPITTIINTLYEIERLCNVGIIHMDTGNTLEDQMAWRRAMVAAIPGMGMKTVSFALHLYNPSGHLYNPSGCLLYTIDRWHIRRLATRCGFKPTKIALTTKQYLCVEEELRDDCSKLAETEPGYWPVTYAAYFWELTRKQGYADNPNSLHKLSDGYQYHGGLSVYE